MNIIFKRTSVRKYKPDPVTQEQIELLLRAAMAAPSARNIQPWEFVVVEKRESLNKIKEIKESFYMLKEAPLAIVVCADTEKGPEEFKEKKYWIQDCSAATENIMLQAAELQLGSVWLGVYPKEEIYKAVASALNLPKNVIPVSIVAIGHPEGKTCPKNKFDESKIHYENW